MSIPPPDAPQDRTDERIADTLTFRILIAANRIAQPFAERVGQKHDLTLPEWRCMMALATEPAISGEDIARKMGMDKMGVSRSLRRLAKAGRVQATPDPANSKRNQWRITQDGWTLFDLIVPEALARDDAAFANLDAPSRALVMEVLAALDTMDGAR